VHRHHVELFNNMTAAAPPLTFSSLYGDTTRWTNPTPDYAALAHSFGTNAGIGASLSMVCHAGLSQAFTLSPLVVAFVSNVECDTIYVAHSLSVIPGDLTSPTALDDHILGLVRDDLSSVFAVVFPHTAFTVIGPHCSEYCSALITHHGAAPPVFRTRPHLAADPNASNIRGHPVMVLPAEVSALALRSAN
jgi:hypothetical protein